MQRARRMSNESGCHHRSIIPTHWPVRKARNKIIAIRCIRVRVDGALMRVLFLEGQMVKAGDLLMDIDLALFERQDSISQHAIVATKMVSAVELHLGNALGGQFWA